MPMGPLGWLASRAALAPPAAKTRLFRKVFSGLSVAAGLDCLDTNFGLEGRLRFSVSSRSHDLLYGQPQHNLTERSALRLAQLLTPHAACFLDVGANHGLFSAVAANASSTVPIFAFEPDPELFVRLERNFRKNGMNATAIQAAASDVDGTIRFYRNLDSDDMGSCNPEFAAGARSEAIDVEALTLASFMAEKDLSSALVKIDVEGAGVEAWDGLKTEIDRVDWLIFEIIGPESEARLPARIIENAGFCAYYLKDFSMIRSADGEFTYVAPFWNWLFCRKRPADLRPLVEPAGLHVVAA